MRPLLYINVKRLIGLTALLVLGFSAILIAVRTLGEHATSTTLANERAELGKQLFNDPRLSADGTVRCASCHIPEKNYSDGRRIALGVYGRTGTRNTPSLAVINAAKDETFFWDGRRSTLEQAVLDPLTNPMEMGLHDQTELIQKIEQNQGYRTSFAQAFSNPKAIITPEEVATALAAYLHTLHAPDSAYDRYAMQNDQAALNQRAKLGLAIFKGKGRCAECHLLEGSPAMLTDHDYHRTGVGLDSINQELPTLTQGVIDRSLRGAAIGDRIANHVDESQLGRFNVTLDPADIGLFRTPSLHAVALTAPYMHDGSVPTLDEAIDREVYYRSLQAGRPLQLTVEERLDLKAFLESL